jgi:UDP:flavonoid glycosyltransferase YjiC (YdhE family)
MYDQPLIAHRIATELGLGINLDFITLQIRDIRNALFQLLVEKSFHERCVKYSKLSRQYDGKINATNRIVKYIKANRILQQQQREQEEHENIVSNKKQSTS